MNDESKRTTYILSGAMVALAISYTMIVPFLPVYLAELGVAHEDVTIWSGVVFSVTFLVAGIMAPVWGRMADEKGRKLMAVRAGIGVGLSYGMLGFVTNPWQLVAVRAFQGFANGFVPAAMTIISVTAPKDSVGTALGIFQTGLVLGNVVGPLTGGLLESFMGMRPVFYVAGIMVLLATAVVAAFIKEPVVTVAPQKRVEKRSFLEGLKAAKANEKLVELLWLYFIMQGAILMLQPILALYVGEMKGTMEGAALVAGAILSCAGIAGASMVRVWSEYGQRTSYYKAISLALTGTGVFMMLQSIPFGIWWFAGLQILLGCCIVGINPSLSAAVTLCTEPQVRGRVFGLTSTAQQLGSMIGPIFASLLTTFVGFNIVFLTTGLLLFLVSLRVRRRHAAEM